jgi:OFA family oxalate/formate antiporter-like MFS transporter
MSEFDWTLNEVAFAYALAIFMFAFSTMIGGKLQDKYGPRIIAVLGGIIYGAGLMLTSTATTLTELYIFFGILVGSGVGIVYICNLSTGLKWYPERRGFISGVVLGAFGLGALVFTPLVQYFIGLVEVSSAFFYLGIVYSILIIIGALFLRVPDQSALPAAAVGTVAAKDFTAKEMLKNKTFYKVWIMFFFAATAGHLIIGNATKIGIEVANLELAVVVAAVAVISLFNTAGRLVWGTLSDKIGRFKVLTIIFTLTAITMALLGITSLSLITFYVYLSLIAFCFGGFLASFPPITGEFFGFKHYGINYGIMYQAFGVAGLAGFFILSITGGLENTFLVIAVLAALGAVLAFISKDPNAAPKKTEAVSGR